MTVAEVAGLLKLNQQTIRNWIDAGSLPAVRIGRRVRVLRSDFEHLIEAASDRARPTSTAEEASAQGFWDGTWQADAVIPGRPPSR